MAKVPGADYLMEIRHALTKGDKCEHSDNGQWLVLWNGTYYALNPSTQLQKDIWLGEVKKRMSEDEAIKHLRWLCHNCGTVQMP